MTSGDFWSWCSHEHTVCVLLWWDKISFCYGFHSGWIHSHSIKCNCRKAFTTVLLSVKLGWLLVLILTLMWGVLIFWGIFSMKLQLFYSKTPLSKPLMTHQYDTLHLSLIDFDSLSMSVLYMWHLSAVIVDLWHLSPVPHLDIWHTSTASFDVWHLSAVKEFHSNHEEYSLSRKL